MKQEIMKQYIAEKYRAIFHNESFAKNDAYLSELAQASLNSCQDLTGKTLEQLANETNIPNEERFSDLRYSAIATRIAVQGALPYSLRALNQRCSSQNSAESNAA